MKDKIALFLLYGYLLVDSISGITIREYGISISFIYKFLMIVYLLLALKSKKLYIFITWTILLFSIYHTSLSENFYLYLKSIEIYAQFILIFVCYLFFAKRIKYNIHIRRFFIFSYVVLVSNILLGSIGFGYSQYGGDISSIGTKRFIYAGNEIAGALFCVTSFFLIYLYSENKYKFYFIFGVLSIFVASLTGTKASIGSVLISFLIIPFLYRENTFGKNKAIFKFFLILIFPIIGFLAINFLLYEVNLFQRISYFSSKHDYITVLLSGRNVWFSQAIYLFLNDYSFFDILFGRGVSWWSDILGNKSTEIDAIDVLMSFGLVGFLIIYGFFIRVFILVLSTNNERSKCVGFCVLMLLAMSLTSGHIVFSATAGPLIGALMSFAYYKKQ
ncbi:MAG: hypothetical protein GYB41_03005 [Oceanospirillales bacterium]|nr:hypothetical protein [Oceanospirillales bacterium]